MKVAPLRLFDVFIASVWCTAYAIALCSTAIDGFWTGPDFHFAPTPGWNCLLSGWFHFPIGWLANPLLFVGVLCVLTGHRVPALICAVCAVALAYLWTYEFSREFSPKLLMSGYDWWLGSTYVLAVGSLSSLVIHSHWMRVLMGSPTETNGGNEVDPLS